MRTAIIYASMHHGNTYKLVEAIKNKYGITVFDATKEAEIDLSGYDIIGFASGIAFGKFYPQINRIAESCLPEGKKIFFLYTCGNKGSYTKNIRKIVSGKSCDILGTYGCQGWDTYGPLKLVCGINKCNPTEDEISAAVAFYEGFG